jgi:hypothetical protein
VRASKVVQRNSFHVEIWLPWQPKGIIGKKIRKTYDPWAGLILKLDAKFEQIW